MEKLQYISQGETAEQQLEGINKVLQGGCKWVQLRLKDMSLTEIQRVGIMVKDLCQSHGATFIINDHVAIAQALDADGIHLGLEDISIEEARKALGENKIIGGTANTWEHVLQRIDEGADYIGLGPLRFTPTKKKLSPILGLEGYQDILAKQREYGDTTPIVAIGGVTAEDLSDLMAIGLHGVAVSAALLRESDPRATIQTFNEKLYATTDYSR